MKNNSFSCPIKPAAFAVLLFLGCFTSCYKDKGNYKYHPINDIAIAMTDSLVIYFGDTLKITPVINQAQADTNERRLKYQWSVSVPGGGVNATPGSTEDSSIVVLSTSRNLNMVVTLSAQSAAYALHYSVTDTATNVTYRSSIKLLVTTRYSIGWMLLEQGGANADISFINTSVDSAFHNVYSAANPANPLPPSTNQIYAFNIPSSKSNQSSGGAPFPAQVLATVLYANGGYVINSANFVVEAGYPSLFTSAPSTVQPQYMRMDNSPDIFVINAGQLYRRFQNKGSFLFSSAFTTYDSTSYYLAPYSANIAGQTCYYDTLNHRFLQEDYGTTLLDSITSVLPPWLSPPPAFMPGNVTGKIVLGMGISTSQTQYALMKDAGDDSCFLYSFVAYGYPSVLNPNSLSYAQEVQTGSPVYLFTTSRNQLYYALGNTVYMYDLSANAVSPVYNFPSGENITTMQLPDDNDLVVATYNGGVGTVYFFTIDPSGSVLTTASSYTGFGKVVNMAYHN